MLWGLCYLFWAKLLLLVLCASKASFGLQHRTTWPSSLPQSILAFQVYHSGLYVFTHVFPPVSPVQLHPNSAVESCKTVLLLILLNIYLWQATNRWQLMTHRPGPQLYARYWWKKTIQEAMCNSCYKRLTHLSGASFKVWHILHAVTWRETRFPKQLTCQHY